MSFGPADVLQRVAVAGDGNRCKIALETGCSDRRLATVVFVDSRSGRCCIFAFSTSIIGSGFEVALVMNLKVFEGWLRRCRGRFLTNGGGERSGMPEVTISLDGHAEELAVFGSRDQYLRQVRDAVGVKVLARHGEVRIEGDADPNRASAADL